MEPIKNKSGAAKLLLPLAMVMLACGAAWGDPSPTLTGASADGAAVLTLVTNATKTSTASAPFYPRPDRDLGLYISVRAANSGTSNTVFGFNFSPDGTLFTTTLPLTATVACLGSNVTATAYVSISKTNLFGVRAIRWDSTSTTQTNGVTASVQWAYLD